jgi:hypothetical protein
MKPLPCTLKNRCITTQLWHIHGLVVISAVLLFNLTAQGNGYEISSNRNFSGDQKNLDYRQGKKDARKFYHSPKGSAFHKIEVDDENDSMRIYVEGMYNSANPRNELLDANKYYRAGYAAVAIHRLKCHQIICKTTAGFFVVAGTVLGIMIVVADSKNS